MSFLRYLVPIALVMTAGTGWTRWQTTAGKEDLRKATVVEASIARQTDRVASLLFQGQPVRWKRNRPAAAGPPDEPQLVEGWSQQSEGVEEPIINLHFDGATGQLCSLAMNPTPGVEEQPMTAEGARTVAGIWLNRLGFGETETWTPEGDPRATPFVCYSRWRSGDARAFVAVYRRSGLPALIRLRYGPAAPLHVAASSLPALDRAPFSATPTPRF